MDVRWSGRDGKESARQATAEHSNIVPVGALVSRFHSSIHLVLSSLPLSLSPPPTRTHKAHLALICFAGCFVRFN